MILLAIREFIKALPLKVIGCILLVALGFTLGHRAASVKFNEYRADQATKVAALEKKAAAITTVEVTKYVDRVQVVHEKGDTLIKKVPVYVPRNVCVLPAGFRSLHDSAALPGAPGVADASRTGTEGTAGKP